MRDEKNLNLEEILDYEEPVLLGAEDLQDVAGGCASNCANGDCKPQSDGS